jgi:hypothetical protein
MKEIKSGIVLYPEGEVSPNIARQLGIVAGDVDRETPDLIVTVHAVPYNPELVLSAVDIYYPDSPSRSNRLLFFPPFFDDKELKAKREQLISTAKDYLVDNYFGVSDDEFLMYRRRIDLIAPAEVPEDGLAVGGIGHMINIVRGTGASSFQETAHPWLQNQGKFETPSSDSNIDILDYRFDIHAHSRIIIPSTFTLDAIASEILHAKTYRQNLHGYF